MIYTNPIFAGDYPDPTILKDGNDYYMTFSSFLSYPGITIWHSKDLINWIPICNALEKNIGSVWALDLIKHKDRYYIYIPAMDENYTSNYVIYADNITGPWSEPIDLNIQGPIDPGHAVGEDGKRYLFFNGVRRIELSDDGLSIVGELEDVYKPWSYPKDWVVEMFAPEGPKLLKRGDYYYMILAVGGTAGPATSHMVISARSKSIHGPWVDCPYNPVIHTESESETWWSKGHASLVEGPKGDWWMVYHAYENGFRTLGRQTLLEPIEWDDDDWFRPILSSPDREIETPFPGTAQKKREISDNFDSGKLNYQWSFYSNSYIEGNRVQFGKDFISIISTGENLKKSPPLTCRAEDKNYTVEVSITPLEQAQGGVILYYDERMYCGIGFDKNTLYTYNYGSEHKWMREKLSLTKVRVRLENSKNVITYHYSLDNGPWIKHPWQMEVSGIHHNVFGGFTSLKIGLFSINSGSVEFRNFTYKR